MRREIIFTCPYYNKPGEPPLGYIPAGTLVQVTDEQGTWTILSDEDPGPWAGKRVRTFYIDNKETNA